MSATTPDDNVSGVGGRSMLLTNENEIHNDLRLIERAIRKRWGMQPEERADLIKRLMRVVNKDFTTRVSKDGEIIEDDEKADANAISAARVLVMIEGQDQADEHKFLDKQIPDATNETPLPLADAIHEPQYLEYLEATQMAADRHARTVGNVGQQREVETGETPTPTEQGTD